MSSKAFIPKVQTTAVFADALAAAGLDPLEFADAFAAWKQDWPKWVDLDYYFGKDGGYVDRARGGASAVFHSVWNLSGSWRG